MHYVRLCFIVAIAQLALFIGPATASSRILGFFITPSRSHFIIHDSLMRGLAAKGHQVTVVSIFPPRNETIPNYRYIHIEMSAETAAQWSQTTDGLFESAEKKEIFFLRFPAMLRQMVKMNTEVYAHPAVQRLKRDEQFDLFALGWFFNDFHVGLAAHFKCPAVVLSSTPAIGTLRDYVGNPAGLAYQPSIQVTFSGPMTFKQRTINFLIGTAEELVVQLTTFLLLEPTYTEYFPATSYPSYAEAKKNVALVLVTSHFSQSAPIASFPALIEVSGMHIPRQAKELPKNVKHWLDTAKDGVIYFSMGSNIKSTQINSDRRAAILRVFSRLRQRVLWKWEDEQLPGKPDNVMVQKWLPQSDILAHPNVRLFITHCGKGSLNEARLNGVPVLGVPVFADQPENLAAIVTEGWAVPLQYADLTEETFERALQEALTNSSYGRVASKAAALFVDRPMHPLDTALFWVEYVIRHKGAKHMQSQAVHLNWFQYHSLDVLALLAAIAWISWKIGKFCLKSVISLVFQRRTTVTKPKKA